MLPSILRPTNSQNFEVESAARAVVFRTPVVRFGHEFWALFAHMEAGRQPMVPT